MGRTTRFACVLSLGVAIAACAAPPPSAPCGGGHPWPWCTGVFPTEPDPPAPPVRVADLAATRAALARACPAPTAEDAAPGLSSGARQSKPRGCRIGMLPYQERRVLEELLGSTPSTSEDHARILLRLASVAFVMEYEAHRDCRALATAADPPVEQREQVERRARGVVVLLYQMRAEGAGWCTRFLREHPGDIPALCGGP